MKEYTFLPLRIILGIMFINAGLPKLINLISGSGQTINFFTNLGIPFPVFFAWTVAIIEIIAGVMLLLGLLTWWASFLLVIIMSVAGLTTSLIVTFDFTNLVWHLVFIVALITIMLSKNTFFSIDEKIGWHEPF